MHHLTDISSQVEAVSETALADLQSELLHSIIKEVRLNPDSNSLFMACFVVLDPKAFAGM